MKKATTILWVSGALLFVANGTVMASPARLEQPRTVGYPYQGAAPARAGYQWRNGANS